jgi:methionyl-tRNA synthetase
LLKNLGNFVNRVIKFVNSKTYDSVVPDPKDFADPSFEQHVKDVNEMLTEYNDLLTAVKLRQGLMTAMNISGLGNKLLQDVRLVSFKVEVDL